MEMNGCFLISLNIPGMQGELDLAPVDLKPP